MKKLVAGILAHVDAGKTTLSESMLYLTGTIRSQGRVDHQDTFLDYKAQERQRGITIFSKVSRLTYQDTSITFIDTPGHVDFAGEMERALAVLDVAVLMISGLDGVQSHTRTIWSLLKHYQVPTLIFVNKMDIAYHSEEELLKQLQTLSPACIPFEERYHEEIAMCSDDLLEDYLTAGAFDQDHFKQAVINRQYFPCLFGSALKNQKVTDLLELLISCSQCRDVGYKQASIYKIDHDDKGERLTFIRVDGGRFHVKDEIDGEKINQIRFYQGSRYTLADEAGIGDVVALTGLKKPQAGDLLGQSIHHQSVLQPFMRYKLTLPADCDKEAMLAYLVKLGEEEPLLHLQIRNADQILISLMGEVQIEIVREMIKEATGVEVSIDEGEISYRETILAPVEGVGHFEPLRHYAEVHVLLEPLPRGSGVVVENHCMNHLSENFQRLIMTHLQEIEFIGVLTGSPITDIKLSLLGGQAHLKHTEGGDFRQATYRAVRQGLMKAQSLLLEPYAHFIVTIPSSMIGRLYFDFEDYPLETISDDGQVCILKGQAPYSFLAPYTKTLISYTKGQGRLVLSDPYYDEVINMEDVLEKNTYDPELDYDHPTGSIFCSHGAGYYVPYDQVALHMHLDYFYETKPKRSHHDRRILIDEREIQEVMKRTYGEEKRRLSQDLDPRVIVPEETTAIKEQKKECLLVDGYNVIFASEMLSKLADVNLAAARDRLIDLLASYQGYRQCELIVVFDAYKVQGSLGSTTRYHDMHIVYTKEAQTADMYIESATKTLASNYRVVVATSDYLEQRIVIGHGATRISARELFADMETTAKNQKEEFMRKNPVMRTTIRDEMEE